MLSNSKKKFVNSLKQKKFRQEHNLFVVEGVKMVEELLKSDLKIDSVFGSSDWINNNLHITAEEVSEKELASISSLKTPNEVLAIVHQQNTKISDLNDQNNLILSLDRIQDPGNLGTIIRTADWFGIKNVICSLNCVESYNPKVIQASMGSLFRVSVIYTDLMDFFTNNKDLTVYGALLDGDNVYEKELKKKNTVLLMGNESKGISEDLVPFITDQISIPKLGEAESLNVALATAILCSEFKRNNYF